MKIKTFRAGSFREALALVKKEMGEDAVILSTGERKGDRPSVEVSAAVDYEIGEPAFPSDPSPPQAIAASRSLETPPRARGLSEVRQLRDTLSAVRGEVGSIRRLLEASGPGPGEASAPAGKREIVRYLGELGVREEHARALCGTAGTFREVRRAMLEAVTVRGEGAKTGRAVVLVGPTGVGKTTTVAKLAASGIRAGKRVAIVSLDGYRIGAIEQIRIYSRIMGVPLEVAKDARQVKVCVERHADKDAVYIDTAGRNPRGGECLSELAPLYESDVPVETHLLLSATSDYGFLVEAWKSYSRIPVDCVGVTKVDEATRCGPLYNVSALCGRPIAYLTTGQTVPGDIAFPGREDVLQMIFGERQGMPAAAAQG